MDFGDPWKIFGDPKKGSRPPSLRTTALVCNQNLYSCRYQNFVNFGICKKTTDTERHRKLIPKPTFRLKFRPIPRYRNRHSGWNYGRYRNRNRHSGWNYGRYRNRHFGWNFGRYRDTETDNFPSLVSVSILVGIDYRCLHNLSYLWRLGPSSYFRPADPPMQSQPERPKEGQKSQINILPEKTKKKE